MNNYALLLRAIRYIVLLLPISLQSQSIITDRPDQTESSFAVGKGQLQVETGVLVGYADVGGDSERQILAPTTLFRLGIVSGLELRVVSQFENIKNQASQRSSTGISDIEIGAKIELLNQEDKNVYIGFLSHLVVPTGSLELTSDKYGTVNKLAIAHNLSDRVGLGYNIGYNYFGEGSGDLNYSIALGIGLNDKVGIYLEPFGEWSDLDDYLGSVDAGFTYLLHDRAQLDFSFGTGINHTMNYLSIGFSWITGLAN